MRHAMLALILAGASGCDKAKDLLQAGQAAVPPQVAPEEALKLDAHPIILFQIFGERSAPRMIPIAALREGRLDTIRLDQRGWSRFDELYLRAGVSYTIYNGGQSRGKLTVNQGMWERPESIYSLPGCRTLTPIAAVSVNADVRGSFTVELLASNGELGAPRTGPVPSTAQISALTRRLAAEAGETVGISQALLDSLDFHARAINTGRQYPTLIASFIDPSAETARSSTARAAHMFMVADADVEGNYYSTYVHATNGPLAGSEYRRFFDHLDVTGDGLDEIIVEGWQFGGDTFLAVLELRDTGWQEVFRTRSNWCLDERPRG